MKSEVARGVIDQLMRGDKITALQGAGVLGALETDSSLVSDLGQRQDIKTRITMALDGLNITPFPAPVATAAVLA